VFRDALLIVGAALLAVGLIGIIEGWPLIPAAVFGAMLVLSLLFERYVYKPIRTELPGPGWERTGERFVDPRSGRDIAVYFNPRTGERRYVADENAG
jgi:hypothetical protein